MKFLRVVVTTLFLIIVQAWALDSDCTGEICCSYPNQGVGCDTVANCKLYGGSIINTCSTQCNCDGSIELAALKLISQNCTEVGMDKAGSPVCLATELSTSLRKSPGRGQQRPPAPVPEVSTVAFKLLPQDVSCPPFMHEVWSPTGLICVMNQLTVEQVAAVHVMPVAPEAVDSEPEADYDPDCQQECCLFSGRIACLPNCSGIGQRVSCSSFTAPLLSDDPPACYTCFFPSGKQVCSTAAICMAKGGNPILGCNDCS